MSAEYVRVEWRGPLVHTLVSEASDVGVKLGAEAIFEDAQGHVPYDEGDLSDSGEVNQGRDEGGRFTSEAFVSYDTDYAVRLHEHPEYNFQGQGEGKWLEHAVQRNELRWANIAGMELAKVFALP